MKNIFNLTPEKSGLLLLRFGLVVVYFYFGISQLLDAERWVGLVPEWVADVSGLSAVTIVMMNGAFEVVCAVLLTIGIWMVPISFLLAAHLAVITITVGFNPTGARDFGLTLATLAHGFLEKKNNN